MYTTYSVVAYVKQEVSIYLKGGGGGGGGGQLNNGKDAF